MKRTLIPVLLILSVFASGGVYAATVDVAVDDNFFSQRDITINAGDTVRWTKTGSFQHTTTSGAGCVHNTGSQAWDSGSLVTGQPFSHTFQTAGTFPYFCAVHCSSGMNGVVRVNAAPILPLPISQEIFDLGAPIAAPVISDIPGQAKPIAIGARATGGATVQIQIGLAQYQGPVNLLFLVVSSNDPSTLYLLSQDDILQPPAAPLQIWRQNVSAAVSETPFGGLPKVFLKTGTYDLYLVATPTTPPAGQFPFHAWHVRMTIP